MAFLSEAQLETALLDQLTSLGFASATDEIIGPDGSQPERDAYDEVVLKGRLGDAVARLNPTLPSEAQADAIDRKSTRLNSSHVATSYAVFCVKKKKAS